MSGSLIGKLAVVTGAGSGIGRATCHKLVEYGAKVVAADLNIRAAEETAKNIAKDTSKNNVVVPIEIDVSDFESVQNAVKASIEAFHTVPSIIVNSAGITRDGYLLKMSEKDYDDVYNVNLKGTFMVTQQFAKAMIENSVSGGSIINLSSIVAKMNNMGQANYAATKAGVVSFTKVASNEFGKFGIRVNAILPGYINTPMVAVVPQKIKEQVFVRCPLGRLGEPQEVAEVIAFLASNKSSYGNGAAIDVTGGLQ